MNLLAYDREHVWHPYTSMTDPTPVRVVTGAHGVRLTLDDGAGSSTEVIDGMSSWWAAVHGYAVPELDAAVRSTDFAHVMFGGLTHAPAVQLAERLVGLAPEGIERVFLADSGSVSVEVALKMALQYQRGRGRPERTRMLTIRGGYHGDTFGAMSVCDPDGGMHAMWGGLLPQHLFASQPPAYDAGPGYVVMWESGFRELAERHQHEIAAVVVEPVLQGAGGMWPYEAECLEVMREVCDELGFLLVLDEIATGFGRTGELWGADHAGISPDIMCVGKALGGGYLTIAATMCTDEVARGISGSESGVLMHGPTFMGNALACRVALASLDLLEARDWRADVTRITARLVAGLDGLPGVRTLGAVGVVQLDHPVDVVKATDAALEEGVWLRPFRDLVYTMPPYACTDDDVDRICRAIHRAVEVA